MRIVKYKILIYKPKFVAKHDKICCKYHALDSDDTNASPLIRYINSFIETGEWTFLYER